ncbi:unnamed protein product [Arctogadus glacialis]
MVLPLKTKIIQSMAPSEGDSIISRDVKAAIKADLNRRYTDPPDLQNYLHRSTALDPRFKSLSHLDPALRQRTYNDLTTEIVGQATEPTGGGAGTSPPQKKSAMEALFGETFAGKEVTGKKPFLDAIEEEVAYYRAATTATGEVTLGDFVSPKSEASVGGSESVSVMCESGGTLEPGKSLTGTVRRSVYCQATQSINRRRLELTMHI